jgi:hypothetical protein
MAKEQESGHRFQAHELPDHYHVATPSGLVIGSVVKVPDGGWRAYDASGDEVAGGVVYGTRELAADAIDGT